MAWWCIFAAARASPTACRAPTIPAIRGDRLDPAAPARPGHPALFAAGVSLGGNALLKWLAEQGAAAAEVVYRGRIGQRAARPGRRQPGAVFGVQPRLCAAFPAHPDPRGTRQGAPFPGRFDLRRAESARTLRDFDDAVTAPLHGFLGADDYYARSSAGPLLATIRTPTLLLHAANDPFLPARGLAAPRTTARRSDAGTPPSTAAMSASYTVLCPAASTGCRSDCWRILPASARNRAHAIIPLPPSPSIRHANTRPRNLQGL
jgi:hypothetical protein